MSAIRAISRVVGYSAAKAGIDNFTRWLAVEVAQKYGDGMRVNANPESTNANFKSMKIVS
jgi:NAD(P)-dependent dehydrogenase (short-subunit alcohol dehydrogenase family)